MEERTPLQTVFDAFQARILEDEWEAWDEELVKEDFLSLLDQAIPNFKFPRTSLEYDKDEDTFYAKLSNFEIQILASYMKIAWLNRCVLSWQHLKPLYAEADFSQANLIDKFTKLLSAERAEAVRLENLYYRSINNKPYDFTQFAERTK